MNRRDFIVAGATATGLTGLAGLGSPALAQNFVEGKHYRTLAQPVPVSVPAGKIELIEFFWYGCPHCNEFEHPLSTWSKKLPADVVFKRVHVAFRPSFEPQQRLAAALESLGLIEQYQGKIFHAIHGQGMRLDRPEAIIEFMASLGLDKAKFTDMYNSFGVASKVKQGKKLAESFGVDGVPALGIHGRYYTSPSMAGGEGRPEAEGHAAALALTEQLLARARKG